MTGDTMPNEPEDTAQELQETEGSNDPSESEELQETPAEPVEDPQEPEDTTDPQEPAGEPEEGEDEPETFPRSYVERLRRESAGYRERAGRADELAAALWQTRVEATGRLADPTDLPMPDDADPLDSEAVTTAVDDLLARKPHLASRRVSGDVGQGASSSAATVDLAGILRSRAS